jgi:hypothetical protein
MDDIYEGLDCQIWSRQVPLQLGSVLHKLRVARPLPDAGSHLDLLQRVLVGEDTASRRRCPSLGWSADTDRCLHADADADGHQEGYDPRDDDLHVVSVALEALRDQ